MSDAPRLHGRLLMYVAALAAIALYWSGLSGPFILDDTPNLAPLQRWLDGQATALELIFSNTSGSLGRPVSMLTLWASGASGGMHPFPFKLGNLLIHIACGFVGWQLLRRLLARDARLASHANEIAALLAGLWLLHPINVSTVLYAVQRMAQLSTLFVLLSVWAYLSARQHLADGRTGAAKRTLFLLFPALLLAGMFSKENAAVAPALCLVIELAYFLKEKRPGRALQAFFSIFLLLPAIATIALLVRMPDRLLGAYATRDFTLWERLLSQPRALMEYIGLYAWPRGELMGVYVDDFAVSTSLWSPPTTLWALLALVAVSIAAVLLRARAPSIFAGWFFFLAAHAIESSFLPLELYFEHRNYLPGFGLLLMSAGVLELAASRIGVAVHLRRRVVIAMASIAAVGFSIVTFQQVRVWQTQEGIVAQALAARPSSLRAILAQTALDVRDKRYERVRPLLQRLERDDSTRAQFSAHVSHMLIDCLEHGRADPSRLERIEALGMTHVALTEVLAYRPLANIARDGRCGTSIAVTDVADHIDRVLDKLAGQPDASEPKWMARSIATQLFMAAEEWDRAEEQGRLAWQPGSTDTAIGGLLVRIYLRNGKVAEATRTLDEMRRQTRPYDRTSLRAIDIYQSEIDAAEASPGRTAKGGNP